MIQNSTSDSAAALEVNREFFPASSTPLQHYVDLDKIDELLCPICHLPFNPVVRNVQHILCQQCRRMPNNLDRSPTYGFLKTSDESLVARHCADFPDEKKIFYSITYQLQLVFNTFLKEILKTYMLDQAPDRNVGEYAKSKPISAIIKDILEYYCVFTPPERNSESLGLILERMGFSSDMIRVALDVCDKMMYYHLDCCLIFLLGWKKQLEGPKLSHDREGNYSNAFFGKSLDIQECLKALNQVKKSTQEESFMYGHSDRTTPIGDDEIDNVLAGQAVNWILVLKRVFKIRPEFQQMVKDKRAVKWLVNSSSLKTHHPVIHNTASANYFLGMMSKFRRVRGEQYLEMDFDGRFEMLKVVTRTFLVTLNGLQEVHYWFMDGQNDDLTNVQKKKQGDEFRIRTVEINICNSASLQGIASTLTTYDGNPRAIIRLRSSPKGKYLKSRYRLKFGVDTTLTVFFSFPRMGLTSQLFVSENNLEEFKFKKTYLGNNWDEETVYNIKSDFCNTVMEKSIPKKVDMETFSKCKHLERVTQEHRAATVLKCTLESPISIAGFDFHQLCQNTSGMHSYKYTYYCGDLADEFPYPVEYLQEFFIPPKLNEDLYNPENKLKLTIRLSLLNTPIIPTVSISEFEVIGDNGLFTDGCGFIAPNLAKQLYNKIKQEQSKTKAHVFEKAQYNVDIMEIYEDADSIEQDPDNVPSAFQIRFRGAKGMLVQHPNVKGLVLRESMIKFQVDEDDIEEYISSNIHVVGYAEPSNFAFANTTIIFMMSGCSDGTNSFEGIVMNIWKDYVEDILKTYSNENTEELMKKYFKEGDFHALNIFGLTKDIALSFLVGPFRTKILNLKLPIENARRVYGVADPLEVLEEDEVFVRIRMKDGTFKTLEGPIAITKEPCLHRGDLRLLKAKRIDSLEYLSEVIVFPIKGKRAIPNMITGSDLDGDKYLVVWDEKLVSSFSRQFEPGNFDEEIEGEKRNFEPDVFKDWIGLRHSYADYYGYEWSEGKSWKTMERLSDIVNMAVDAPKKGKTFKAGPREKDIVKKFPKYPHFHSEKTKEAVRESQSIVGKMYDFAIQRVTEYFGFQKVQDKCITANDDKEYLLLDNLFEVLRSSKRNSLNAFLNFIWKHYNSITMRQTTIQFASEFLDLFWRFLCMLTIRNDNCTLCALNTTVDKIDPCSMERIINNMKQNHNSVLLVQGISESKLKKEEPCLSLEKIYVASTCSLFKFSTSDSSFIHFLFYELFFDAASRLQLELGYNLLTNYTLSQLLFNNPLEDPAKIDPSLFKKPRTLFEIINKAINGKNSNTKKHALFIVGLLFKNGRILPRNYMLAFKCFQLALPQDNNYQIGFMSYLYKDEKPKVMKELNILAKSGYADAQYNLGRFYYFDGEYYSAMYWLKLAAHQCVSTIPNRGMSLRNSLFFLAGLYNQGVIVNYDVDKSIEFYTQSAMLGHIDAMYALGKLFEQRNEQVSACYWFERAAHEGIFKNYQQGFGCRDFNRYRLEIDEFNIDSMSRLPSLPTQHKADINYRDAVVVKLDTSLESELLAKVMQSFNRTNMKHHLFKEFYNSTIISPEIFSEFVKILPRTDLSTCWKLIFKGSRDGFKSSVFHHKCDNKGPTVSIVKTSDGEIYGGFTNQTWMKPDPNIWEGKSRNDESAFIFYCFNNVFYKLNHRNCPSIECSYENIINFFDITIPNHCEIVSSRTDFGRHYEIPKHNILNPIRQFLVTELEVYSLTEIVIGKPIQTTKSEQVQYEPVNLAQVASYIPPTNQLDGFALAAHTFYNRPLDWLQYRQRVSNAVEQSNAGMERLFNQLHSLGLFKDKK